jgi:universal stress protein A
MSTATKILVAIDDPKSSEATLHSLVAQFDPRDTEVLVLHVVEPLTIAVSPQMAAGYAPELEAQLKDARMLVERAAKTLVAAGFKVETEVREGDSREMIIDSAKRWRADLIVMGSHGRKGLTRLLLGSVAETVARHAPCSVEIVRMRATRPKILLAVDNSKFSEAAIQLVIQQVRPEHAEVCILYVVDLQIPMPTSYAGDFRQVSLEQGKDLVGRLERLLAQAGFKTQRVIEEGDPRTTVVDYAKQWGANLIVVGSHGRKGLDRFLLGSVAEFVARHASCSVEIVRVL